MLGNIQIKSFKAENGVPLILSFFEMCSNFDIFSNIIIVFTKMYLYVIAMP